MVPVGLKRIVMYGLLGQMVSHFQNMDSNMNGDDGVYSKVLDKGWSLDVS
jgi:hypothetical protein